jgi:hypothetical protein
MANTKAKHHDSQGQKDQVFEPKVMDLMQDKSTEKLWSEDNIQCAPKMRDSQI